MDLQRVKSGCRAIGYLTWAYGEPGHTQCRKNSTGTKLRCVMEEIVECYVSHNYTQLWRGQNAD